MRFERAMIHKDKWFSEDFFVLLLLFTGPDPEPETHAPSPTFTTWNKLVIKTIGEQGAPRKEVHKINVAYWEWLQSKGLAWRREEFETGGIQ